MSVEESIPAVYFVKYIDEQGNEQRMERKNTHPGEIFMDFMKLCASGVEIVETNIPSACVISLT